MTIGRIMLIVAMVAVLLSIPSCGVSIFQALQDTTVYAPGYSERKFHSIRLGMSREEVIRVLGPPLEDLTDPGAVSWYYGPPSLMVAENGAVSGPDYTYVMAPRTGKITGAFGDYLGVPWQELIGKDLAEMRRRYGEPVAIRPHAKWRYLAYSGTREDGSYYIRRFWLDSSGRVKQIEAQWYQD